MGISQMSNQKLASSHNQISSTNIPTKPTQLLHAAYLCAIVLLLPLSTFAQSPFDTGFSNLANLFTGTIAKVASLIAIVVGGYTFAHGEPGAKRTLAAVAAGTGIAVLAGNVLSWLWGA